MRDEAYQKAGYIRDKNLMTESGISAFPSVQSVGKKERLHTSKRTQRDPERVAGRGL